MHYLRVSPLSGVQHKQRHVRHHIFMRSGWSECACCGGWDIHHRRKRTQKTEDEAKEEGAEAQENRSAGRETHQQWYQGPQTSHPDPGVVFLRSGSFKAPPQPRGSGEFGIDQCNIQSDIHQVPPWAPRWADEMRVVSAEASSLAVVVTRDTSHWAPGSVTHGQWFSLQFPFVTPA